jgi:hypothetical protein
VLVSVPYNAKCTHTHTHTKCDVILLYYCMFRVHKLVHTIPIPIIKFGIPPIASVQTRVTNTSAQTTVFAGA